MTDLTFKIMVSGDAGATTPEADAIADTLKAALKEFGLKVKKVKFEVAGATKEGEPK